MAYGGTDPAAAVVGHAPVETLLVEARRYLQPRTGYPDDPVTAPFRAGDVVGRLERARAAVGDARALRETIADDVREAAAAACGALADSTSVERPALAAALVRPVVFRQRTTLDEMAKGSHDAVEAYTALTGVAMQARAVPAATRFVAERLAER